MSWPLQDNFQPGPVNQVPCDWFNTVARILNYLGSVGCSLEKTPLPSAQAPWRIIVDATAAAVSFYAGAMVADTGTGSAGTAGAAARGDHAHPLNVDATTPAAVAAAGSAGTATTYARRDHVHAGPVVGSSAPPAIATDGAAGSSAEAARADHTHALGFTPLGFAATGSMIQDGGTPAGPAPAGFLGTSQFAARVDHIHPVNVNDAALPADVADAAAAGTSLRYARADHVHKGAGATMATATPLSSTGTGAVGTATKAAREDHQHPLQVDATAPAEPANAGAAGSATTYPRRDHAHPAQPTGLGSTVHIDTSANGGANASTWVANNAGKQPVKLWRHRYYYRATAGSEAIIGVRHYEIYNPVTGGLMEVGPEAEYTMHTPEYAV